MKIKSLLVKIKKVLISYYNYNPIEYHCVVKSVCENMKHDNVAFVFGAPFHSNMGDQAQSYCTELWIKSNYIGFLPVIIETRFLQLNNNKLLLMIKENIKQNDIIFLHSGYHTTDIYMREEQLQRDVIRLFPNHRIVILPQTINYTNPKEEDCSSEIYNRHNNLYLLARDDVSYEIARKVFPKVRLQLFPDIVTTQIGVQHFANKRKGILLCLRDDKEGKYSIEEFSELTERLSTIDFVDVIDTSIDVSPILIRKNRRKYLNQIWDKFSRYRVVITDRYHGTIFSLIAGTPVLVISSTDHKLSSGVKWFPDSYKDYVQYIDDIEDVPCKVDEIYKKEFKYQLPEYFNTNYYDKLKRIIDGYVEDR